MARNITESGSRRGSGGGPGLAIPNRPARLLVAGTLAFAATFAAWFGASIVAFDFTRAYKDSNYAVIGAGPLLVGVAATVAAWSLIREEVVGARRTARVLFVAAVFALPAALGVAHSVYQERLRPTYPYLGLSLGYTFDYPRGYWTFLPAERPDVADESIVFMNWAAFAPDAPVPAGGLRVQIGPHDGAPTAGEPFAVGKGRYPGTIVRQAAPEEGGPQTIAIVYAANGRNWRIAGTFAEPPDAANPNTKRFFGIVGSLRHDR